MPEPISNSNHLAEVPLEILDAILNFLPKYSSVGEHSVHSVSHSWNALLKADKKNPKAATSKQLVESIGTEKEALHFFDNLNIADEMRIAPLLRLAFKVPKVRDALVPELSEYDLIEISEHDIECARFCLSLKRLDEGTKALIRSFHEDLCHEYLNNNPLDIPHYLFYAEKHLSVARRILAIFDLDKEKYTFKDRFQFIAMHTQLVEENIQMCSEFWEQADGPEHLFSKILFFKKHTCSHVVANFLCERYRAAIEPLHIIEKYQLLLLLSKDHWGLVSTIINDADWLLLFNSTDVDVRMYLSMHFEIAKKYIENPHFIIGTEFHFNVFYAIAIHFPNSRCFLLDSAYYLGSRFYKEYGPVLALPRMQRTISNPSSTSYDFKLALLQSIFDNPRLFYYLNMNLKSFLINIIDELHPEDFALMKPTIISIFENDKLRNILSSNLIFKLFSKMPRELGGYLLNETLFKTLFATGQVTEIDTFSKESFLLQNPVLARAIMNKPELYNLLSEYERTLIKNHIHVRDCVKQAVLDVKQEMTVNDKCHSLKP